MHDIDSSIPPRSRPDSYRSVGVDRNWLTNEIKKTRVGKILSAHCADSLKKLTLELGGNCPFLVFDDANLEQACDGKCRDLSIRIHVQKSNFILHHPTHVHQLTRRGGKKGLITK